MANKTWEDAKEANTELWQACLKSADSILITLRYMNCVSEYTQQEERDGFAATIYNNMKEIK